MRRMGGWLTGAKTSTIPPLLAADELAALKEATTQAAWVMNDEVDRALTELKKGTTPFHKLGEGATLFWQSLLSFDKELMVLASQALNEAEEAATEHLRMATRDPKTAHQSKIYPAGSEYLLCQAQSQLLGAILGILKESWTESLTGLNKLRKGYFSFQSLHDVERKYVEKNAPPAPIRKSEDDADFHDAEEGMSQMQLGDDEKMKSNGSVRSGAQSTKSGDRVADHIDFRTLTTDPIDLYVHSGVAMVWGIVKIALSVVPPAMRSIMALFSLRGDREEGLRLLWDATDYKDNIFGAIASLATLLYNHVAIALADILVKDAIPEARLKSLLRDLRKLYPDSQLWLMEEAREAAIERDLDRAIRVLEVNPRVVFPAIQGMRAFEKGLNLMFLHRFQDTSDAFIQCVEANKWSHGMYYYIAACSNIELYRDFKDSDRAKAKKYAEKAKEFLVPVPALARKKALMGRQLPFDAFIQHKLDKWETRATSKKCDLIDAVGVSPIEELTYFWTGYRRMQPHQLQISLDRLVQCESQPGWQDETPDELASQALLKAIALRFMGKIEEAKTLLQDQVFCHTLQQIKSSPHPTDYPLPVGHYEMAVCLWQEIGGENGSPEDLRRVNEELEKCHKWTTYDLEERMVAKVMAAKETLKKCGIV